MCVLHINWMRTAWKRYKNIMKTAPSVGVLLFGRKRVENVTIFKDFGSGRKRIKNSVENAFKSAIFSAWKRPENAEKKIITNF